MEAYTDTTFLLFHPGKNVEKCGSSLAPKLTAMNLALCLLINTVYTSIIFTNRIESSIFVIFLSPKYCVNIFTASATSFLENATNKTDLLTLYSRQMQTPPFSKIGIPCCHKYHRQKSSSVLSASHERCSSPITRDVQWVYRAKADDDVCVTCIVVKVFVKIILLMGLSPFPWGQYRPH
jgi:hypothetical protein